VSGQVYKPNKTGDGFTKSAGGVTFTSHVNGLMIPGALDVYFDIPAAPFNTPQGQAYLRIPGVGLQMIGQSSDFNPDPTATPYKPGANIVISAGMQKGLPLANPAQAGAILQGTVFQAYGNWQGVNQSLEILFNPGATQPDQDIMFSWPAGMQLSTALSNTFQQAFAKYATTSVMDIADITQDSDGSGHYTSLSQLSAYVQEISQNIGAPTYGADYSGVLITITGNTIYAYDSENPRKLIQLAFNDLIGQPTWIEPATISFKTVLRSDIAIGNQIKCPAGISAPYALTSAAAAAPNVPARSKLIFQGAFNVNRVQHFASFRQADADSWTTSYEAVPVTSGSL
jgi:hypothetical protein